MMTDPDSTRAETCSSPEDLREEAFVLNTMLDSISQGLFMVGSNGRVIAFNQRVCELLNLSPDFLAKQPIAADVARLQLERGDFGPDANLVDEMGRVYIASLGKTPAPEQYWRSTPDGRVIEVKNRLLPSGGIVKTFTDVTDYKLAQAALQQSTVLLDATQAVAGVGGWEVDAKDNQIFWTNEMYRMLDTSATTFSPTPHNVQQFFTPDSFVTMDNAIRSALADGSSHDLELQMTTAHGRNIWVHAKNMVELDEGKVLRTLFMVRNITAEHESKIALRDSEFMLRTVTSQVPGMVYRIHTSSEGKFRYSFVSDGVEQIFGVTPAQAMADASSILGLRHPADKASTASKFEHATATAEHAALDFRIQLKDGTVKWVQMTSAPEGCTDGETIRTGVLIDITAQRRVLDALRESEAKFRRVMAQMPGVVYRAHSLADGGRYYSFISPGVQQLFGVAPEDVLSDGQLLPSFFHPDDKESILADMAKVARSDDTVVTELRIRLKDGTEKWIQQTSGLEFRTPSEVVRIGVLLDITARKQAESLIWQQANFDTLTGLPNRRMLRDRLTQDIKKCRREKQQLAVLFIDLDHFKEINDTLGHAQGDALLVEAATRITQCVRDTDTVARMGGDEFTVVLPVLSDVATAEQLAATLIEVLGVPFQLGAELAFVSASIGITVYPQDGADIDSLFKHADQAMYAAKAAGRNRFSHFTPALQSEAQARMRLTNDLRGALGSGQFWLAYQPIVKLSTGQVQKAEALLRWQHPERGLISPAHFIPIAERSGLIVDIGEWVFRQAAQQAAVWRRSLAPDFQISVNKSPVQFHSDRHDLCAWFSHLKALGLPGDSIVLEITESLLLDANPDVNAQLLGLRNEGVRVALDDFGTGYSSLSYLQQHNIDFLKIDKSFVSGLTPQSKDMALCKAIILMAHELGIQVIAEGVETVLQRDLLTVAGCDYAQGYLFARPMPAADFESYFNADNKADLHRLFLASST